MTGSKKNILILLLLSFALLFSCSTQAAVKKYKNRWVKKNGYYYYYDKKGKKAKGLTKIGDKTYYFTSKGKQRNGWRKIGDYFYFFNTKNKAAGYMVKSKKVNGIKLDRKGRAVLKKERAKRKAQVMADYQTWLDTLVLPSDSKKKKLRTCFDYLRRNLVYRITFMTLSNRGPDWDLDCAEFMYAEKSTFECYSIACAFAYFANAIGYTDVRICAHELGGGHGWVEIGQIYYDPSLARHDKESYYYFDKTSPDGIESPIQLMKKLDKL